MSASEDDDAPVAPPPRPRGKQPVDWTTSAAEPQGESDRNARRRVGREAADEATQLAETLIDLPDLAFGQLDLDDELREVIRGARGMRSDNGQRRTIRGIAGMLRLRDRRPLQAAFLRLEAGKGVEAARFQAWEQWRARLINEGDGSLDALVSVFAHADRQALRNLIRAARKEQEAGRPARAFRDLFRALRALDDVPET